MSTEENINKLINERYREEILAISKNIQNIAIDEGRATIDEDKFVHIFLPFFAGEENIYNVGLGNWITVANNGGELAGGQFREVDVIDETGKVLFTVPPIYDRSAIKPVKLSDKISLAQLMEHADKLGSIKPKLKTSFNNQIFEALLKKMKEGNNNAREYLIRWNEIFTRYGRKSIFEEEKNSDGKSSDSGEIEYEIEEF